MSGSVSSISGALVVGSTGGLASGATGTTAAGVAAGPTGTVDVGGVKPAAPSTGVGALGVAGGAMVLGDTDVDVAGPIVLDGAVAAVAAVVAVAAVGTAGATAAAECVGALVGALLDVAATLLAELSVVDAAPAPASGTEFVGALAPAVVERPKSRPAGNPMRAASVMPASA